MNIIPIESIQVSNDTPGHEAILLFDGKSETTWKPQQISIKEKYNFIQLNYYYPHLVRAIDILFSKNAVYTILVEFLPPDNSTFWTTLNTFEVEGDESYPVRINIPTIITKSIRLSFISYIDEKQHTYLVPEVAELRVYGDVKDVAEEPPSPINIPPLTCPKGYSMDENGDCISEENKIDFVQRFSEQTDLIKYDSISITFDKPITLYKIILKIEKEPQDTQLFISIKDKFMSNYLIQKGLDEYEIVLNKGIDNVTKLYMELISDKIIINSIDFLGSKHDE